MPSLAESPVHILRVWTETWEEDGETQSEREWEVEHAFECPRHVTHIFEHGGCVASARRVEYTCAVQYEIDNSGLDSLRFQWEKYLPDGEYRIIAWYEVYHNYEYGPEADGGLDIDAVKRNSRWVEIKEMGELMFAPDALTEWVTTDA